jgi:hypothetical protein
MNNKLYQNMCLSIFLLPHQVYNMLLLIQAVWKSMEIMLSEKTVLRNDDIHLQLIALYYFLVYMDILQHCGLLQ